ncbi:MAG: SulP family inorganic anion transporter [Phaeodactylibacter sp.]|nr:SulP family inorganic anion transporter [Phaeodactylibacter sp.]
MPAITPFSMRTLAADFHAGIMIFIVALPLYLGIAMACGAPVYAGIISGVVGGVVVALLGGSVVGVSGPSAGLASIMIVAISTVGYENFLVVVALSGLLQILLGFLNLGTLGYYFPAASIKGMIASIGIVLILKQFPYFIGMGEHHFTHFSFHNHDGTNSFTLLLQSADVYTPGALLIGLLSLFLLWFLRTPALKRTWLATIPAYLIVLSFGVLLNLCLATYFPGTQVQGSQLVNLPSLLAGGQWNHPLTFPDFNHLSNPYLFRTALALALISSLEALLVVEAAHKMDPLLRSVNLNRELKGQGVANFITGLIGGVPITQVIVLNATNINSGGQTRMASVFHGLILLICWLFLPELLNWIPLASLAAILIALGYQLTSISIFRAIYRQGWHQFLPFLITIIVILFTDILTGVIIGIIVGFFFLVREQNKIAFVKKYDEPTKAYLLTLGQFVSFLSKGSLQQTLENIPENALVRIDGSKSKKVDLDILSVIRDFRDHTSKRKNIRLEVVGLEIA